MSDEELEDQSQSIACFFCVGLSIAVFATIPVAIILHLSGIETYLYFMGTIIVAFILAAILTPTIDPINQCLVAAPLIVLYEMSIWLARLVHKREPVVEKAASSSAS